MRTALSLLLLAGLLPAQDAERATGADPEKVAEAYDRQVRSLFSGRALRRGGPPAAAEATAALDRLCAKDPPGLETRGDDLRAVVRAYLDQREDGGAFVDRVDALRADHTWDGRRPLDKRKGDPRALLLTAIDARLHQQLPPEALGAHPAAAAFPGEVAADVPRVERRIELDTAIPRWASTGLWAPAGEVVTLEVPELEDGVTITVVVGSHTDSVVGRPRWARFPVVSRRYRIDSAGSHAVANAFGGLIYLAANRTDAGVVPVVVRGAVEAPMFVLGSTSVDAWQGSIRDRPAPFGELACDRIVWTLPSGVLRECDAPDDVLRFWAKVIDVQDDLAHNDRTSPERFVLDRQISVGYMHSGYPLMGPVSAAEAALDLATLREKGNWGMFHEIGHNHQTVHYGTYANPWTFDGNVEVTVNVFSSWTYVAALERSETMGHQHWRTDMLAESLEKDFTTKPYAEKSHRERCLLWVHLIEEFGWDAVKAVFGTYAAIPAGERPRSDLAKRSLFLEIWSKQVGRNLAPFFDSWGLAVTDEARAAVGGLPEFTPRVSLPSR